MRILLVHHADAVGAEVDAQRPLSLAGRDQAARMAQEAKARGCQPAAIWHSGKLRARETAQPFLQLNPFAAFKMVRGLLPEDPPEFMRDTLRGEDRELVLVGHMPNMPALAHLLSGSDAFPTHGIIALETNDGGLTWKELWRARP
jgi:phosphohistidine phosphatase